MKWGTFRGIFFRGGFFNGVAFYQLSLRLDLCRFCILSLDSTTEPVVSGSIRSDGSLLLFFFFL